MQLRPTVPRPKKKIITIRDLYERILPITNITPSGQRLRVQVAVESAIKNKPTKAQGIIMAYMSGTDLGAISLNQLEEVIDEIKYESIDGGHRKDYIQQFIEGMFSLPCGKKWGNMTDDEREDFMNIELFVAIYPSLTPLQSAYVFTTTNKTTNTNHQEDLNSFNEIWVAKFIRETVRDVPGIEHVVFPHEIFEVTETRKGELQSKYLNFENKRLVWDELVARLYHMILRNTWTASALELELMYDSQPSENDLRKTRKELNKVLDFVLRMAFYKKQKNSSAKMTKKEFVFFTRMYIYLARNSYKISDNLEEVFIALHGAFMQYRISIDQATGTKYGRQSPFDSTKSMVQQFNDSCGEWNKEEHALIPVNLALEEIDSETFSKLFIALDPVRNFSKNDRMRKLAEQKYKCAVDGLPLTLSESHAAHKLAACNGGPTDYDNLAMVRAKYNIEMGSMHFDEYMEIYNKRQKRAA